MNCERPFFCSGQGRGTYCDGQPVEGFRMLPDNEQVDIAIAKEIRTGDDWGLDDSHYGAGDKSIKDCLPKVKRVEKLYDPMKDTDQHKLFGE